MESIAFHARHELNDCVFADVLNQAVDDLVTQIAVGHLAALEAQRSLDLVAFLEKADGLVLARDVVVIVDGHGEFNLLDDDDLLALARGAIAFFFLVEEFAVILNAANGGNSGGRNLHEIETSLAGDFEGFKRGEDTKLLTLFVDHANFPGADTIVDTDELLRGTLIDGFFSWARARPRGNLVYQPPVDSMHGDWMGSRATGQRQRI